MKTTIKAWKSRKQMSFEGDLSADVIVCGENILKLAVYNAQDSNFWVTMILDEKNVSELEQSIANFRSLNSDNRIGEINQLIRKIKHLTIDDIFDQREKLLKIAKWIKG